MANFWTEDQAAVVYDELAVRTNTRLYVQSLAGISSLSSPAVPQVPVQPWDSRAKGPLAAAFIASASTGMRPVDFAEMVRRLTAVNLYNYGIG
jgi:hypothetical protein